VDEKDKKDRKIEGWDGIFGWKMSMGKCMQGRRRGKWIRN
jgi:hypothetical protein